MRFLIDEMLSLLLADMQGGSNTNCRVKMWRDNPGYSASPGFKLSR
jgi:hypothetical protein